VRSLAGFLLVDILLTVYAVHTDRTAAKQGSFHVLPCIIVDVVRSYKGNAVN